MKWLAHGHTANQGGAGTGTWVANPPLQCSLPKNYSAHPSPICSPRPPLGRGINTEGGGRVLHGAERVTSSAAIAGRALNTSHERTAGKDSGRSGHWAWRDHCITVQRK